MKAMVKVNIKANSMETGRRNSSWLEVQGRPQKMGQISAGEGVIPRVGRVPGIFLMSEKCGEDSGLAMALSLSKNGNL